METQLDSPSRFQTLLQDANCGDEEARNALIAGCCESLLRLARRMLHQDFREVRRWEDTDDVVQQAWLRLQRSLGKLKPTSALQFYRLAATEIRWELIDLCRRHFGPCGIGANYESGYGGGPASAAGQGRHDPGDDTAGPVALLGWAEFHEQVGKLPEEVREVFELVWYQQLSQEDAANLLGVSVRTVKRRWQRAKLLLHKTFGGQPPGITNAK